MADGGANARLPPEQCGTCDLPGGAGLGVGVPIAYAIQASLLFSLAVSMAWLWHSDAALAVGSLLAAAWIVPLLSRSIAGMTTIPLGLIVMLAFYAFVLRRGAGSRQHCGRRAPNRASVIRQADLNCQHC